MTGGVGCGKHQRSVSLGHCEANSPATPHKRPAMRRGFHVIIMTSLSHDYILTPQVARFGVAWATSLTSLKAKIVKHVNCDESIITQWSENTVLHLFINSSAPSDVYMRRWIRSALVRLMAWRLFGAKLLPEPTLSYCQLNSWDKISVIFKSEFYHFHQENSFESIVCQNDGLFCPG